MRKGKGRRIEVKEKEIPFLEIKVFDQNFNPIGNYSIQNFANKYLK